MLGKITCVATLATLAAASKASSNSTAQRIRDSAPDLGTVLSGFSSDIGNLSTYYELLLQYPNILLQLPSYSGVTIVAPDNDAFTKLGTAWNPQNETQVTNILEYHILQGTVATNAVVLGVSTFMPTLLYNTSYTNVTTGQNVIINKQPGDTVVFTTGDGARSTLLEGDIAFAGGLIQMVDTLLVPPSRLEHTARVAYPDLTAFLAALYATDLISEFADAQNVTLFAPRNAAFQRVAGTLEALDTDALADVLRYHMVPGTVHTSATLANGTLLGTAQGEAVRVTRAGNNVYLDSAQVVQPDILIANGVIHMIDNVLNPNASDATADPSLTAQPPVYAQTGATSTGTRVPTPFTSYLPCTVSCPVPATSEAANATANATADASGSGSITGTRTTTVGSTSSRGGAAAKYTGLAVGIGAGLLGVGMNVVGVV